MFYKNGKYWNSKCSGRLAQGGGFTLQVKEASGYRLPKDWGGAWNPYQLESKRRVEQVCFWQKVTWRVYDNISIRSSENRIMYPHFV